MAISHIIRAEEHLSNTPRQVFILQSLGHALPAFAHVPFVAEPGSKNKLSKPKLKEYLKNKDFAELVERGAKIARSVDLGILPDDLSPVFNSRSGAAANPGPTGIWERLLRLFGMGSDAKGGLANSPMEAR